MSKRDSIFTYFLSTRVLFGNGALSKLGEEIKDLNAKKALIATDKGIIKAGIIDRVKKILEESKISSVVFDGVKPNPGTNLVKRATKVALSNNCDVIVGVGGGSSLDTAKAVSMIIANSGSVQDYEGQNQVINEGPPIVAIPTTAGTGSEVTIWTVVTDDEEQRKMGIGDPKLTPKVAIDDPLLTLSLPPTQTAQSGMDALSHAVESYTNTNTQIISEVLALEAIKLIAQNLRVAVFNGKNIESRYNMLMASLLAAMAFNSTRLGIAHALANPLGSGEINLPHGLANAIMLPYVMDYNAKANPSKFVNIAKAFEENIEGLPIHKAAQKAPEAVRELAKDIGIPSLKEAGVKEEQISNICEEAIQSGNIQVNPRSADVQDLIQICEKAYEARF